MNRIIVFFTFLTSTHLFGSTHAEFTSKADVFFKKYVTNGSVAYTAIAKNGIEVDWLYQAVGAMNLTGSNDDTKKAFYINAYNIIVIYWVAKHLPLKSPLDDSGFFDKIKHKVAGEDLTLNALEIRKLLQTYKDARMHFALACAAKSCPPLANFAYTPEKLNEQLTGRTTLAINDKVWLKVDAAKKNVELSKIFDWYKNDFVINGTTIVDWINLYRKEKIPATYAVSFYEYDWALNEK